MTLNVSNHNARLLADLVLDANNPFFFVFFVYYINLTLLAMYHSFLLGGGGGGVRIVTRILATSYTGCFHEKHHLRNIHVLALHFMLK